MGTVVGAGFASGQEVARFFTHFGRWGLVGLLLATALFVLFGIQILGIASRERAQSHLQVVWAAAGPWLGRGIDAVITFFFFAATAVMFAGAGAVFAEQLQLPRLVGSLLMAVLTAATVLSGLRGVVRSIAFVAPVLLVSVLAVSGASLWHFGLPARNLDWFRPDQAAAGHWAVSALLYASYNLVLAVGVLAPLGGSQGDAPTLALGGLLGGLALGTAALAIDLGLLAGLPGTAAFEVPMLYLTRLWSPALQVFYSLILWAEVYTTAVGNLYGLAVRTVGPEPARFRPFVLGATLAAFLASLAGFGRLVRILYPAVGYAGLAFLGALTWQWVRRGARGPGLGSPPQAGRAESAPPPAAPVEAVWAPEPAGVPEEGVPEAEEPLGWG